MLLELNQMVMAVSDLAACRFLYGGPLGFEEADREAETSWFRVGPTLVELRQDRGDGHPADEEARPAISHIALYVESIDGAYGRLREAQVPLQGPPSATAFGHRNMQRSLLAFQDPNGFTVQVSETIDPREHLEERKQAKRAMAAVAGKSQVFRGIDHIAMYCTDYTATRSFYTEALDLDEFFHSTTREEGEVVAPGFEQGAFAVGGTDIEMATDETWTAVRPGVVRQLGFSTADVDRDYQAAVDSGLETEGPPVEWAPCPSIRQRAFRLRDPDGLNIQISQACFG